MSGLRRGPRAARASTGTKLTDPVLHVHPLALGADRRQDVVGQPPDRGAARDSRPSWRPGAAATATQRCAAARSPTGELTADDVRLLRRGRSAGRRLVAPGLPPNRRTSRWPSESSAASRSTVRSRFGGADDGDHRSGASRQRRRYGQGPHDARPAGPARGAVLAAGRRRGRPGCEARAAGRAGAPDRPRCSLGGRRRTAARWRASGLWLRSGRLLAAVPMPAGRTSDDSGRWRRPRARHGRAEPRSSRRREVRAAGSGMAACSWRRSAGADSVERVEWWRHALGDRVPTPPPPPRAPGRTPRPGSPATARTPGRRWLRPTPTGGPPGRGRLVLLPRAGCGRPPDVSVPSSGARVCVGPGSGASGTAARLAGLRRERPAPRGLGPRGGREAGHEDLGGEEPADPAPPRLPAAQALGTPSAARARATASSAVRPSNCVGPAHVGTRAVH